MNAIIKELEIRSDLKIRKGSIVLLDLWNDGRPIEVEVFEITMHPNGVFIESHTVSYGSLCTHSAGQYKDCGKLIKF